MKKDTDLLISSNDALLKAVTILFQKSWNDGKLPDIWKSANVKFLAKPGKDSYYTGSSYRPISLTSVLGKCMERIIHARLYAFAEHHKILDSEQDGFRKFRGTTHSLLRFSQSVLSGFSEQKATLATFIDMEKAFDSVWRDGLLFKLHDKGVTGTVWNWIADFLQNRSATCILKNKPGDSFRTDLGLPQGSVLSPLLFSIFLSDMCNDVACAKVKFADDGTIWISGNNSLELAHSMEKDLQSISAWTFKWRMKLNTRKTECVLFTRDPNHTVPSVELQEKALKCTEEVTLLGVILDKKLTFQSHIEAVEKRASKALGALMMVGKTEKINPANMIKLYKSLVVPHLEYAASVWQIGECDKLEKIQRKGLALCLGCPNTASCEALEVQAGVLPLDLRREELAIRECTKIMAKSNTEPIKQCFLSCQASVEELPREKVTTPMGKMLQQITDMTSSTNLNLNAIEPEMNYLEYLQPSLRRPEYWSNLGSSKNRTSAQEAESRNVVENLIKDNTGMQMVLAFTDGSCRGNPGPCGAGACVFLPNNDEIELKQPVSKLASILLIELVAIQITLNYLIEEKKVRDISTILIFCDSQSAVGILQLGWENKSYKKTAMDIQQSLNILERDGTEVKIQWSPGHANIRGNEMADRLAKEAAKEAEEMTDDIGIASQSDVKSAARESVNIKWQRRWEVSEKGRHLFTHRPGVKLNKVEFGSLKNQRAILQLQSGYCRLKEYQNKVGIADSPTCECGAIEDVQHFLLECPNYHVPRETLRQSLLLSCGIADFDAEILLTVTDDEDLKDIRPLIWDQLDMYITQTKRF